MINLINDGCFSQQQIAGPWGAEMGGPDRRGLFMTPKGRNDIEQCKTLCGLIEAECDGVCEYRPLSGQSAPC